MLGLSLPFVLNDGVIPIDDLCAWIYNTFGLQIQLASEGLLTAFGAIGLLLQAIPMFFYKFDEKVQEVYVNE